MDMYAALAEPNRRTILELIAYHGSMSSSEIADQFQISSPAISQHLKILREAKIVDMEKKAQQRIYTLNTNSLHTMEDWMHKLNEIYEARYNRLEALLEREKKKIKKIGGEK